MTQKEIVRIIAAAVLAGSLAAAFYRHLQPDVIPEPPDIPQPTAHQPRLYPLRTPPAPALNTLRQTSKNSTQVIATPTVPLPESEDAIPGEYTLSFFNARDQKTFEALATQYGVQILDRLQTLHALRVATPSAAALQSLLKAAPPPLTFSPNTVVRIPPLPEGPGAEAPATPYTGFGSDVLRWLGVAEPQPEWGRGAVVAILDTGFSGDAVARLDLSNGGGNGTHGNAVASLIRGLQGMAPGAELLDIKVLSADGSGDAFTLAKGIIEAVDRGAGIINICAGTRGSNPALETAVAYARRHHVLIIASAGNEGLPRVSYPAGYDGVVVVGGVDAESRHLYFSNTGGVDISAPGIGITVPGENTPQVLSFSGTSASAPLVTAAAALLQAESPQRTPEEIIALLKLYSDDAGAPGADDAIGAGILNVGRLLNRDVPGIVDVAAIRPYWRRDTQRGLMLVDVFGQNRGTETLPVLIMTLTVNGEQQTVRFVNIGVGATAVHTLECSAAAVDAQGLDITVALSLAGLTDTQPNNNTVRVVILPMER